MNTINTQLVNPIEISEQQATQRAVKGFEIYKSGLVEPISNNEFIVSGKYYIEYFPDSDLSVCNCADHSFRQLRCKHIIAVELYQLDKVNGA